MLRLESIIGLHHAAPQSMLIYLKNKRTEFDKMEPYGLSTLATIVAQFGDYSLQCGQAFRIFFEEVHDPKKKNNNNNKKKIVDLRVYNAFKH